MTRSTPAFDGAGNADGTVLAHHGHQVGVRAVQPRQHDRECQLGRVASCIAPRLLAHRAPLRALGRGRVDSVVLVGESRCETHRARLRGSADDDRRVRALHRLGQRVEGNEVVVLAGVGERPVGPGAADDLELLLEQFEAHAEGRELEAIGLVLALVPACADAEIDSSARDVVDGGDRLGEHRWMAERDRRDQHAEAQPGRDGCKSGERRPRLERAALLVPHDREVVIRPEQRADAVLLAGPCQRDPLSPGHALLALDHQLQLHDPGA
jgi:hypothetical protein